MSEEPTPPNATERDVHLSVFLHGIRFDYIACVTAAFVFVQEWRDRHYHDAIEIIHDDNQDLPRLPNEQLYLEP